jgi:Holliday junction resolvase RusA-like endonuclease
MHYIRKKIDGYPAVRRTNKTGRESEWVKTIADSTELLPKIDGPCLLRVTFFLPEDKYFNSEFGADLDNLLKPFLDGLGKTIFSAVKGGDGCVLSLEVSKLRASKSEHQGAYFEIIPFHEVK